ncbi:MAG: hypothetical protein GY767_20870 [Shimia sp.]|nr:hypothetical protein [Shimia sp.]
MHQFHDQHAEDRRRFDAKYSLRTKDVGVGTRDDMGGGLASESTDNGTSVAVGPRYQEGGSSSSSSGPTAGVRAGGETAPAPGMAETRSLHVPDGEQKYGVDSRGRRYPLGSDGRRLCKTNRPPSVLPEVWNSLSNKDKLRMKAAEDAKLASPCVDAEDDFGWGEATEQINRCHASMEAVAAMYEDATEGSGGALSGDTLFIAGGGLAAENRDQGGASGSGLATHNQGVLLVVFWPRMTKRRNYEPIWSSTAKRHQMCH